MQLEGKHHLTFYLFEPDQAPAAVHQPQHQLVEPHLHQPTQTTTTTTTIITITTTTTIIIIITEENKNVICYRFD